MMNALVSILNNYTKKNSWGVSIEEKNGSIHVNKVKLENTNCSNLLRYYARISPSDSCLYAKSIISSSEVDSWLHISEVLSTTKDNKKLLEDIDNQIATVTFLVDHLLTIADIALWLTFYYHNVNVSKYTHISRWFKFIRQQLQVPSDLPKGETETVATESSPKKQGDVGKFVELPGAEMGKVVVRFPPEASGYLHIGHAKAALINQYYQQTFKGKLILRFDDTNPAKENEHFENVIRKDLELLQVKPDCETRTSDHFETLLKYCEQLIKEGHAYADDTDAETMKKEREMRAESKNRSNSVEKNLKMWNEMLKGTEVGQRWCIRAKIDMNSDNGCMRDPTLYRCKNETHVSTGDKFKAYPTYDFACPIVDSIENVTHALRTTEYHDRDEQYFWLLDKLRLRKPYIWEYARLNLQNTVLSKRRLTWLVDEGVVDSWEDPRFPTVRGILRHGMTVEGLKDFIAAQGGSRSVVQMEWDKIWAFNKKVIDPIAPRYTALSKNNLVQVELEGINGEQIKNHQFHPKNTEVGMKEVAYNRTILIEQEDALLLKENDTITLINWGNCIIKKIYRSVDGKTVGKIEAQLNLADTNFKATKYKLTWLPEHHSKARSIPVIARTYSHIISKPVLGKDEDFKQFVNRDSMRDECLLGDHNMVNIKESDIIQIQRKGFFICDRAYKPFHASVGTELPAIFIFIPDGHKSQADQEKQQNLTSAKSSAAKQNNSNAQSDSKKQKSNASKPSNDVQSVGGCDLNKVKKLTEDITACGDAVRQMKTDKKPQDEVKVKVNELLALKNEFKTLTGSAYSPESAQKILSAESNKSEESQDSEKLNAQIVSQGDKVRSLKSAKAPKEEVDAEVKILISLKADYKAATGKDWKPAPAGGGNDAPTGNQPASSKPEENKENAKSSKKGDKKKDKGQASASKEVKPVADSELDGQKKKETKLGLGITMEESYSDWYTQVITKAEMIEYYDVSGCYILRPLSYSIWEVIQAFFDGEIKKLGVENCYFPMFVSKSALEREKDHIEDFAPEVAWVTKSGKSDLAEPIAVRPTSETVMYPAYAKWIQSHRDLPLRLNQWNNVVRWEFKHPTPFLRTREFLWQEGHTAFAYKHEAEQEVLDILDLYARVYEELLAIAVVKGRKTKKEKFPGADFTATCEAFISQCGRGIQGATSHHLGQNFSKMFGITIENPDKPGEKIDVYQNSWGLSTRTIGAMVMAHSDNKGLVLPPRVAQFKVIILPCGVTDQASEKGLYDACNGLADELNSNGIKCRTDLRPNYSPGWKFNHWELKGIPLRAEIGPKDLQKNQVTIVRRDTGERMGVARGEIISRVANLLEEIQSRLYNRSKEQLEKHMKTTKSFNEFCTLLDQKNVLLAPFCGDENCEGEIKEGSAKGRDTDANAPSMGAKSLCTPFNQPKEDVSRLKCINPGCKRTPVSFTMFGRSY